MDYNELKLAIYEYTDTILLEKNREIYGGKVTVNNNMKRKVTNNISHLIADRTFHKCKINDPLLLNEVKDLVKILRTTEDFTLYRKAFVRFTKICGVGSNEVLKHIEIKGNEVSFSIIKETGNKYKTVKSRNLTHQSPNGEIKELKPSVRTRGGTTFYPNPRIYLFNKFDGRNRVGKKFNDKKDGYVYKSIDNDGKVLVKRDNELKRNAVYLQTSNNLPVRKMTSEELKKRR